MIYRFEPKNSDIEALQIFEGFVEIEMPTFKERVALVKKFSVLAEEGEIKISENEAVDELEKIIEIADERIKKVDLRVGESSFSSLSDIEVYSEYPMIIGAIGRVILQGINLGNSQSRG